MGSDLPNPRIPAPRREVLMGAAALDALAMDLRAQTRRPSLRGARFADARRIYLEEAREYQAAARALRAAAVRAGRKVVREAAS